MSFNSKNKSSRLLVGAGALLPLLIANPTFAQGESAGLEEVVVTAQRRSQSLQDVPIAVTALSAEVIDKNDVSSFEKIQGQVLGLKVATGTDRTNITIRGVGSTIPNAATEPGVPVNIDGVYMTRTTLAGAVFGDLAQMEVLRGPQGTLYGRNATGGTINIWTKDPDSEEASGQVSVLAGNGGRYRLRAAAGAPVSDTLSARVGVSTEEIDGYRNNLILNEKADPEKHDSLRGVVRWEPTDEFELSLRGIVSSDEVGAPIAQFVDVIPFFVAEGRPIPPAVRANGLTPNSINPLGGQTSLDPRNVRHDQATLYEYDDEIYSVTAKLDLGWAELKSVSAYQEHNVDAITDLDGTSADHYISTLDEQSHAWTQEFTLGGGSDRLDWVVGAWYMKDDMVSRLDLTLTLPQLLVPNLFPNAMPGDAFRQDFFVDYKQETESLAFFGQATYKITDSFRATVGARYTDESKDSNQTIALFGPPVFNNQVPTLNYSDFSPKFGVDFDLNDNVMLYASATKGFKAGSVNVSIINNSYDPEELWAYEAGVKSDWADGRIRFNMNAYFYQYEGYQASLIAPGQPAATITNAADAELQGLETEFTFKATDSLTFNVNVAYADSEFLEYDAPAQFGGPNVDVRGNQLPLTAEYSGNVGVTYEANVASGVVAINLDHEFSSENYLDIYNENFTKQDSYGRTNLRVGYTIESGSMEGFEVSAFARNIEDEDIIGRADASGLNGGARVGYLLPRTYGAAVIYRF